VIEDGLNRYVECGKCLRRHALFSRRHVPDIDRPGRLRRVCPFCGDEYIRELFGETKQPEARTR
jgi:ribosomal protein S27AE